MKKSLAIFLTVILIIAALPMGMSATAATSGYYTYTVTNGKATITDCNTSISGDIEIPKTLGGYPVIAIGKSAFEDCTGITSVVIPDGITSIGYAAFYYCKGITSLNIPDSVTSIGYGAFGYCRFTSITIPDSVTSIDGYAFASSKLTSIDIPNSITSIGDGTFAYCFELKNIEIPDSVTSIGKYAFESCSSLENITIPSSVTSIGDGIFSQCSWLKSVVIPDGITSIGSSSFWDCTALKSISIPSSVTSIGDYGFYNCTGLTDVWYGGTESDMAKISVGTENAYLTNADWHYNTAWKTNENEHWYECDDCGDKTDIEPHEYDNACDEKCDICGKTRTVSHNYEWITDKAETCGDNGEKHEECTVCHAKRNENTVIPATGDHKYDNDCDTDCNICGLTRTTTHNYEWVIDSEENCGFDGKKHEECTVCHAKRNENTVIPAAGDHTYETACDGNCNVCEKPRTAPHDYDNACDSDCNLCGEMRKVPDHDYGDDLVCDECGHKEYTPGDIDGNDNVDLSDVVVLAQYVAGWDVACNGAALDVDGNETIDLNDVVILAQYVAGWDVVIH